MCLAWSALWMNLWVPYYIINNEVPCKITIFATSLKFLIQLTFLVSLQEQICRKYFLKGFDNFLNHVLGLLYAITNYFK